MENASKALLIAGAILLAIILISLGIFVVNQGSDLVRNNGMSQAQKISFNQRFTQYEGNQKGSAVRAIMQEVQAANSDENNTDASIHINVFFDGKQITNTQGIATTSTYTVAVFYGKNGFVDQIGIATGANANINRHN